MKQFTTFSNVNCNKFTKICLKEFRHVSQQKVDILNIIYDGEYNINYYISLIINERSKQCLLLVQNSGRHSSLFQEVVDGKIRVQSASALSTLYYLMKGKVSTESETLMAAIMKITIFWHISSCSLLKVNCFLSVS
jgi:hypothetical protein